MYSAVIWIEVDSRAVGVTHANSCFKSEASAQAWIDRELPSFAHYEVSGGKLQSEVTKD